MYKRIYKKYKTEVKGENNQEREAIMPPTKEGREIEGKLRRNI